MLERKTDVDNPRKELLSLINRMSDEEVSDLLSILQHIEDKEEYSVVSSKTGFEAYLKVKEKRSEVYSRLANL
jgi:hypothetical protein